MAVKELLSVSFLTVLIVNDLLASRLGVTDFTALLHQQSRPEKARICCSSFNL